MKLFASSMTMLMATSGSVIEISSTNKKLTIGIDEQSGEIQTLQGMKVRGVSSLGGCAGTLNSVSRDGSNVIVKRTYCCGNSCASTEDTFGQVDTPEPNEIGWSLSVEGTTSAEWSAPIETSFQFENPATLKIWMPWNKPNTSGWNDPLKEEAFTNATYNTGTLLDGKDGDTVIAEHATFLSEGAESAQSLISDPGNYPHHGVVITTSMGGVLFRRDNALLKSGVVHSFNMHFSDHKPTFRAGLAHSLSRYPDYWNPINSKQQAATYDGMGSYTWVNTVPQNLTLLKDINYKVNWDLSGRFFPYMGMFLPPVDSSVKWQNDPEGTQTVINVTFDFIDQQYSKQKGIGAVPLSYFNIFEYGLNIKYDPNVTKPTGRGDWRNASDYLKGYLRDSLVTDFSCYIGCGHGGKSRQKTAQGSWQGAVVMDPATESYNDFLMMQANKKLQNLKQFTGVVIDRSDWCQLYSHENPGYSFVNNATATNYAGSWMSVTKQLREVFGDDKTILYNNMGYARLSLLRYTDGTFSEGHQVNAAGLLGLSSPAILWTYDATECCSSQQVADLYFQTRLYMRVFPMAPYPGNDHSIPPGAVQNAYYLKYGGMYRSLDNLEWELSNLVTAPGHHINTFSNQTHVVAIVIQAVDDSVTPVFPQGVTHTQYLLPGSTEAWTDFTSKAPLRDGCVMLKGLLPSD